MDSALTVYPCGEQKLHASGAKVGSMFLDTNCHNTHVSGRRPRGCLRRTLLDAGFVDQFLDQVPEPRLRPIKVRSQRYVEGIMS